MFTDQKEALEAEALELTPLGSDQNHAAYLVVAHQARDKDDLADLLGALGLPCDEDDLVRLLPHLTTPDDTPTGDPIPVNAFTTTAAASMLANGDSPEHVRETLGAARVSAATSPNWPTVAPRIAAQRAAEDRLDRAKAELEAAHTALAEVKAGGRTATDGPAATPPAPARGGGGKENVAAIRT